MVEMKLDGVTLKGTPKELEAMTVALEMQTNDKEYKAKLIEANWNALKIALGEQMQKLNALYDKEEGNPDFIDLEDLLINEHDYTDFLVNAFEPVGDYNLYDRVAKYGAKEVVKRFREWNEKGGK